MLRALIFGLFGSLALVFGFIAYGAFGPAVPYDQLVTIDGLVTTVQRQTAPKGEVYYEISITQANRQAWTLRAFSWGFREDALNAALGPRLKIVESLVGSVVSAKMQNRRIYELRRGTEVLMTYDEAKRYNRRMH
jgi:hypothetical protein